MDYIVSDATISKCKAYRYLLRRIWSKAKPLGIIMLNPSTADASVDDNTIRRCMSFSKSFGCGGIIVSNLFAYRATKPVDLFQADDPVGPENFKYIGMMLSQVALVLCAWGAQGVFLGQDQKIIKFLEGYKEIYCLGSNKNGSPKHPLYVKSSTSLVPYRADTC